MSARRIFARPARYAAIAPYVWMVLFFLLPFGFVLKISLSQTAIAQPPYVPLFDLTEGWEAIKAAFAQLSLDNFRLLVSDSLYISSYLRSLFVAVTSTLILLVIGYPIAYGMARLPKRWQPIAMMLVGIWLILGVYWKPAPMSGETFSIPLESAQKVNYSFSHGVGQLDISGGAPLGQALLGTAAIDLESDSKRTSPDWCC